MGVSGTKSTPAHSASMQSTRPTPRSLCLNGAVGYWCHSTCPELLRWCFLARTVSRLQPASRCQLQVLMVGLSPTNHSIPGTD